MCCTCALGHVLTCLAIWRLSLISKLTHKSITIPKVQLEAVQFHMPMSISMSNLLWTKPCFYRTTQQYVVVIWPYKEVWLLEPLHNNS